MKPTIGRIVYYIPPGSFESNGPFAAIVTSVLDNDSLGLTVFGYKGAACEVLAGEYDWHWPEEKSKSPPGVAPIVRKTRKKKPKPAASPQELPEPEPVAE